MPEPVKLEQPIRAALPFGSVAARAAELVRAAHAARNSERGMPGFPTGLPTLDKAMGGLQEGLHILAAEPGAGKTALALNIARSSATRFRLPVVYASFDETPERLALKVIASRAGLSMSAMTAGELDPQTVATEIEEHAPALATLAFVSADARLSVTELVDQLGGLLAVHSRDVGLLVIDYLQPWAAAFAASMATEYRIAVGAMALELRALAIKSHCPVLLVSAQNRAGQGSASMTSLRESSDLEYGADSILMLTRDDDAPVGTGKYGRTLTLAKNRFGPNGLQIGLVLDGRTQTFSER